MTPHQPIRLGGKACNDGNINNTSQILLLLNNGSFSFSFYGLQEEKNMKTAYQLRKEFDEAFKKRGLSPLNWGNKTGSVIYTKGSVSTNSLKTTNTSSKQSKWE